MAQIGGYVPAQHCVLSPVDRIFTRIGANDSIMTGRSTFMVELQETSTILLNATANSLVILDELGRGTSTFDGYSIAYSVVKHLAEKIKCLTLFSTHYHMLTQDLSTSPLVSTFHMSSTIDPIKQRVVYLYMLKRGVCPKSYGMDVALVAGIPPQVVSRA
eukprot:TRINITY_DN3009_c0_g1_i1.p1 TRINITY_DN3009_c0_g1~~TRINITY_DN3009_c0_g1_i1.p1  ORF type:complete len:160 (-),score=29.52 TRINITY_DN3009_c0_g1_i1:119-598(-)